MALRLCVSALVCGLVLTILGPMFAGSLWLFDLVANLAAQWSLLATALVIIGLWIGIKDGSKKGVLQRWWLTALAGMALLTQGAVLVPGRAVWTESDEGQGLLNVLVFNAYSENQTPERAIGLVERSDADVVVLLEQRRRYALESTVIGERYPWIEVIRPIDGRSPWMLVLSRWPMKSVGMDEGFGETPGCAPVLIETPQGSFGVVAIHARSPRNPRLWRMGNESVRAASEAVRRFDEMGIGAIVAGDLNGAPGGWRSRWLVREGGLRRCKPALRAVGTWPSVSIWPASVAIDDVWTPQGWRIAKWETVGGPDFGGSDHRAVMVELSPVGRLSGAIQAGEDESLETAPFRGGQDDRVGEQGVNGAEDQAGDGQ